jgi:hypothetical protein
MRSAVKLEHHDVTPDTLQAQRGPQPAEAGANHNDLHAGSFRATTRTPATSTHSVFDAVAQTRDCPADAPVPSYRRDGRLAAAGLSVPIAEQA